MNEALSYLSTINWSSSGLDGLMLLIFVIGSALYGILLKREQLILIILMIYVSLAVVIGIPYFDPSRNYFKVANSALVIPLVFAAIFGILFYILVRNGMWKVAARRTSSDDWWLSMLFGVVTIGLLLCVTINLLPVNIIQNIKGASGYMFLTAEAKTLWLLLPIGFMAFFSYRQRTIDEE